MILFWATLVAAGLVEKRIAAAWGSSLRLMVFLLLPLTLALSAFFAFRGIDQIQQLRASTTNQLNDVPASQLASLSSPNLSYEQKNKDGTYTVQYTAPPAPGVSEFVWFYGIVEAGLYLPIVLLAWFAISESRVRRLGVRKRMDRGRSPRA